MRDGYRGAGEGVERWIIGLCGSASMSWVMSMGWGGGGGGFFFFNDTATTEIYTLSLHDAPSDLCSAATNTSIPPPDWPVCLLLRADWPAESSVILNKWIFL